MSAYINLDDGRVLWRSNLTVGALLELIAEQVPDEHRELRLWLADKCNRPSPFNHLDVRGLSGIHREVFYHAAKAAMLRCLEKDERAVEKGGSALALHDLLRMKQSIDNGEPPLSLSDHDMVHDYDGDMEDLSEIWGK